MAAEPMVEFRKVRKAFDSPVVLDDLDLTVARGEKLSVIGPSGSGKSTLLRALMTIETIEGGTIEVDGDYLWQMEKDGEQVPANEAHVRMV